MNMVRLFSKSVSFLTEYPYTLNLFKFIERYIRSCQSESTNIMLGRWSLEYDKEQIDKKVKYANEDNSY